MGMKRGRHAPRRDGIVERYDGIQVQSVGQWDSGGSIKRQRESVSGQGRPKKALYGPERMPSSFLEVLRKLFMGLKESVSDDDIDGMSVCDRMSVCDDKPLRNHHFKISTFNPRRDAIVESDDGIQVQSVGQQDSGGSIIRRRDVPITGRQRWWGRRLWLWLTKKKWLRGPKDPNYHGEATTATTMI